jgi:hypothetical protein
MTLNSIASAIANYLVDTVLPWAEKLHKKGKTILPGADLDLEKTIFGDYNWDGRSVNGFTIDELSSYMADFGTIESLVPYKEDMDREVYDALKGLPIILNPVPSEDINDIDVRGTYDRNGVELSPLTLVKKGNKAMIRQVLAHELRHGLDDKLSSGLAVYTKDKSDVRKHSGAKDPFNKYLKSTHEANARYAAAVSDLIEYMEEDPTITTDEFKSKIKELILDNHLMVADKKQRRRFVNRAWEVYKSMYRAV